MTPVDDALIIISAGLIATIGGGILTIVYISKAFRHLTHKGHRNGR